MSRLAVLSLGLVFLLLLAAGVSHRALADTPPPPMQPCQASDPTTLEACVDALGTTDANGNVIIEIDITQVITCSGELPPPNGNACPIDIVGLNGTVANPFLITSAPGVQGGLTRIDHFKYNLIYIHNSSNVTVSNLILDEEPSDKSITITAVPSATTTYLNTPAPPASTYFVEPVPAGNVYPVPGLVTTWDSNVKLPVVTYYSTWNTECFQYSAGGASPPFHCAAPINISGTAPVPGVSQAVYSRNITLSGVTINHSQDDGIDVIYTQGFYMKNNNIVENSFFHGLLIEPPTQDISKEGNTFFANRAAAFNIEVTASNSAQPSDITGNLINHNQHDDAYGCNFTPECSGGQAAIKDGTQDLVFAGNRFINGFMDTDDPSVFNDRMDLDLTGNYYFDEWLQCALHFQCDYTNTASPYPGYDFTYGDPKRVGGIEFIGPVTNVTVVQNVVDHNAGGAVTIDNGTASGILMYQNEIAKNSTAISPTVSMPGGIDVEDCYTSDCEPGNANITPEIIKKGVGGCGPLNCVWVIATDAWTLSVNSLSLLSSGNPENCAMGIYAPNGTHLATVKGTPNAYCNSEGGTFYIPGSIPSTYASVYLNFQNLDAGTSSSTVLFSLASMAPTITGAGLGCSNNQCIWITATDTNTSSCSVSIYAPVTFALLATVNKPQVACLSNGANLYIPQSILNGNYSTVYVNYPNGV